jgi:rubrerythrin
MNQWNNIDDVLDFAIANEVKATFFYEDLARKVENSNLQELFRGFAKEEEVHAAKLRKIKAGDKVMGAFKEIPDLKISDYILENDSEENLDYQGALILAMKREKATFKLYTDLANASGDAQLKVLFAGLAQEEAKHKLRFELEYDQHILGEN